MCRRLWFTVPWWETAVELEENTKPRITKESLTMQLHLEIIVIAFNTRAVKKKKMFGPIYTVYFKWSNVRLCIFSSLKYEHILKNVHHEKLVYTELDIKSNKN